MISEERLMRSALQFISGESVHVCRLCLESSAENEVYLEDFINVQKPYFDGKITVMDAFTELKISLEPDLPNVVCEACVNILVDAYLFQKLTEFSDQQWSSALKKLDSSLSKHGEIVPYTQTAYIIISKEKTLICTSKKRYNDKTSAVQKLKHTLNNKKCKLTTVMCDQCGMKCSRMNIKKHMATHKKELDCAHCLRTFTSHNNLKQHIERVHTPKTIHCKQCNKKFATERILKHHVVVYHSKAKCNICLSEFPSRFKLRQHMDNHLNNKCPKCNKTLAGRDSLKQHLLRCGNPERKTPQFFCDLCRKGFVGKNGLRSHIKIDHGFGNVVKCHWCDKKYDAISKLKLHEVKHTRERNFYCEHCGGQFVTRAALTYHTRTHTGEKPFKCDLCEESFLSASRRLDHKKRKHFEPTKICHICNAKFVMANPLKKHIERHYNPQSKLYVLSAIEGERANKPEVY